jgi:hypothetical protein
MEESGIAAWLLADAGFACCCLPPEWDYYRLRRQQMPLSSAYVYVRTNDCQREANTRPTVTVRIMLPCLLAWMEQRGGGQAANTAIRIEKGTAMCNLATVVL